MYSLEPARSVGRKITQVSLGGHAVFVLAPLIMKVTVHGRRMNEEYENKQVAASS
jgi:hypothetical protein